MNTSVITTPAPLFTIAGIELLHGERTTVTLTAEYGDDRGNRFSYRQVKTVRTHKVAELVSSMCDDLELVATAANRIGFITE